MVHTIITHWQFQKLDPEVRLQKCVDEIIKEYIFHSDYKCGVIGISNKYCLVLIIVWAAPVHLNVTNSCSV